MSQFVGFPKMARLSREIVITEKIDGTNASIFIQHKDIEEPDQVDSIIDLIGDYTIRAGSRTKWITPKDDNYGFANWVKSNSKDLIEYLGEGRHFGEWWGSGIQRGYGLTKGDKRFSLFNVIRWHLNGQPPSRIKSENPMIEKWTEELPACCSLVPELYRGVFDTDHAIFTLMDLRDYGSKAAPGFMKPEGIVLFHIAGNVGFKKTLEKDDEPKSKSNGNV